MKNRVIVVNVVNTAATMIIMIAEAIINSVIVKPKLIHPRWPFTNMRGVVERIVGSCPELVMVVSIVVGMKMQGAVQKT